MLKFGEFNFTVGKSVVVDKIDKSLKISFILKDWHTICATTEDVIKISIFKKFYPEGHILIKLLYFIPNVPIGFQIRRGIFLFFQE